MGLKGKQWAWRACVPWLFVSGPSLAQNADTLTLSGGIYDDQGTLQLESPSVGEADSWYLGVGMSYADDPVVAEYPDGSVEDLLQVHLATHVLGGYNVLGLVRVDVDAPLYPYVRREDTGFRALGDLRISATVPLWSHAPSATDLALVPQVTAPTGTPDLFVSDEGFTGSLTGVAGGKVLGLGWVANLGLEAGAPTNAGDTTPNLHLQGGVGLHYRFNDLVLAGAEVDALARVLGEEGPDHPVEGHAYGTLKHRSGLRATMAAGAGLIAGVGSPDWRVVAGVAWGSPGRPADMDGDGLADARDRCVDSPEDPDDFEDSDGCPDKDNDQDGIPDPQDACPNAPEDFDDWHDVDGCPDPDNDQDGMVDSEDECPVLAGPIETWGCPDMDGDTVIDPEDNCPEELGIPDLGGCPDSDGDNVPDFRDACPEEAADARVNPRFSDGCSARVLVGMRQIHFDEKIFFDFAKSTIRPVSHDLLYEIGELLLRYPEISSIEVGGHTDSVGSDAFNLELSGLRAQSVVAFLEQEVGVSVGVLNPVGYGETLPIATNETEAGRGANRRVAFSILQQDAEEPSSERSDRAP